METLIRNMLKELLDLLGVTFTQITVEEFEDSNYRINVNSDEAGILIGKHGDNIRALQHLLKLLVWKKESQDFNIILDIDGYRQRQEENVMEGARRKAELVREHNQTQVLEPMSPYFRRIVHTFLATDEFSDLTTESTGNGDR